MSDQSAKLVMPPMPDKTLEKWADQSFEAIRDALPEDRPLFLVKAVHAIAQYTRGKPALRAASLDALVLIGRHFRIPAAQARSIKLSSVQECISSARPTLMERIKGLCAAAMPH